MPYDVQNGPNGQALHYLNVTAGAIKQTSVEVSKSLYQSTKSGLTKIMKSNAVNNLKSTFKNFLTGEKPAQKERSFTITDYNTA
jgi:hypothetical protein